jgi:hypothetical protein
MPKPSKKNEYFTQETENAIIEYNQLTDQRAKDRLFTVSIYPAFNKLSENLIHTFKFRYLDADSIPDLQHEIMVFLLEKIHRFDPSLGAKAYSYFGTIIKRWLIVYNDKNYKKLKKTVDFDDITGDGEQVIDNRLTYELYQEQPYQVREKLIMFTEQYVNFFDNNLPEVFPDEYDRSIADSILELFRKRESIDIFNKKALYLYIREIMPVAKTVHISKIAKILKAVFELAYEEYDVNEPIFFETYVNKAYERLSR